MSQETIRQAWREKVWNHAQIAAITQIVIERDLGEDTHKEISSIRYKQEINFFGFRVRRRIETLIGRKRRFWYLVDVSYTRWADPRGINYNTTLDAIELVADLVQSQLGSSWNGTVEDYQPQAGVPNILVTSIGDEKVYRAEYSFEGIIGAVSN